MERVTAEEYFRPLVKVLRRLKAWACRDWRPSRSGLWHWLTLLYVALLPVVAGVDLVDYVTAQRDQPGEAIIGFLLMLIYTAPLGWFTGIAGVPLAEGIDNDTAHAVVALSTMAVGGLLQAGYVWRCLNRAAARPA